MIWKNIRNIKELNSLKKDTLLQALDINFQEIGDDYLTAEMPVNKNTVQPAGLLHGGASAALAETLGSVASILCLDNIDKQTAVGTSITSHHLRAINEGSVLGVCSPIKIGRRLHIWHIEIYDEADELINVSQLTAMIIDKK